MSKKSLQHYFDAAKELPLATSFDTVEKLVRLKGVPTSPPQKWWWNLNNLIIMSTTALIISIGIYLVSPSKILSQYESVIIEKLKPIEIDNAPLDFILFDENEFTSKDESNLNEFEDFKFLTSKPHSIDSIWENVEEEIPMPELSDFSPLVNETSDKEQFYSDTTKKSTTTISKDGKEVISTISTQGIRWFELKNSKGDIRIHAWDKEEIELRAQVEVETKKKENQEIALADFQLKLEKQGEKAYVESNWEDIFSCMCSGNSKKDDIKTANGEKVKIKELKLVYDVYLPKDLHLELSNSYAGISMPDWTGDLNLKLFKGEAKGGNVRNLTLKNNYGKAVFSNFENIEGSMFKAELIVGNGKQIDLKANYSELEVGQVEQADLNAFQSNGHFKGVSNTLNSNFRYGKLTVDEPIQKVDMKCFQSNLFFNDVNELELNLSYTKVKLSNANQIKLENAFQSSIDANEVGAIKGNLKYTPLNFSKLNESLDITSFQGKIKIDKINAKFSAIQFNGKYTDIDLNFDPTSSYHLNLESNYTNLNLPDLGTIVEEKTNSRRNIKSTYNPTNSSAELANVGFQLFQGSLSMSH